MTHAYSHKKKDLMIDALPLIFEGGISNYVKPLVGSLLKHTSSNLQFKLLFRLSFDRTRNQLYKKYLTEDGSYKEIHFITHWPDRLLDILWSHGRCLPVSLLSKTEPVFIATTEMVPQKGKVRVGWVVFDLTPLRIPKFFPGNRSSYCEKMKSLSQRTDFIVTISNNSKNDIIELISYPEDRIYVIYPGVTQSGVPSLASHLSCRRPYIYYLGSLALNKNVDGMLRIFSACVNQYGLDLEMVLTGKDFCGYGYWSQLIQELNIEGRVHITGWIPEQERENYLNHAKMLWQFSWYEGFGLPVLEAASRGIPVLYSNRGAIPEILNNPEQEIDPANEQDAIERAAHALQSPGTLATWKRIGLEKSRLFSWARSAQKLLQHLETLP
jgi:glycosyltransferase involved in cell wall biosynthesis